jgi:hypothetical protein
MCIILASAEAFTLYVLSKMAERYQGKTYGTLVRKALGKKLSAGDFEAQGDTASQLHSLCTVSENIASIAVDKCFAF